MVPEGRPHRSEGSICHPYSLIIVSVQDGQHSDQVTATLTVIRSPELFTVVVYCAVKRPCHAFATDEVSITIIYLHKCS